MPFRLSSAIAHLSKLAILTNELVPFGLCEAAVDHFTRPLDPALGVERDLEQTSRRRFVDVANHLVAEKYVAAGNISISGRSAGGELMGAAVLDSPELWRSVNLGVPFVDVLATMLDASLPLTPPEWAEWGNPLESVEAITARDYRRLRDTAEEYAFMLLAHGITSRTFRHE